MKLDDDVALIHYRLERKSMGSIELMPKESALAPSWLAGGKGHPEIEKEKLSTIVDRLNERFAPELPFTSTDQLFFDQIIDNMAKDEGLAAQANANPLENYRFGFEDKWDEKLIDLMDNNQTIFARIINDPEFGSVLKDMVMEKVYEKQRNMVATRPSEIRA